MPSQQHTNFDTNGDVFCFYPGPSGAGEPQDMRLIRDHDNAEREAFESMSEKEQGLYCFHPFSVKSVDRVIAVTTDDATADGGNIVAAPKTVTEVTHLAQPPTKPEMIRAAEAAAKKAGQDRVAARPVGEICPNSTIDVGIDDAVLDREITIAFGSKRDAKDYKNRTDTVEKFLARLEQFRRGPKDGQAILQGALGAGDGQRTTALVSGCDLILIDVDTGASLSSIAEKIKDRGLFAVMWTTYSHLRPTTDVAESAFIAYCKKKKIEPAYEDEDLAVQLVDYLVEEKRMEVLAI